MRSTLFLLFILFSLHSVRSEENPFIRIIDKSYPEIVMITQEQYDSSANYTYEELRVLTDQFKDVAKMTGSEYHSILADQFEAIIEIRNHILDTTYPYTFDDFIDVTNRSLERAEKIGSEELYIVELFNKARMNKLYLHNYEEAFQNYKILEDRIEKMSVSDFPFKYMYLLHIGDFYLTFKDYESAQRLYYKIVNGEPGGMSMEYYRKHAFNGLALYYRERKDITKSNQYLQKILDAPYKDGENLEKYEGLKGVAKGNLGLNDYMQGEYKSAIVKLKESIDIMRTLNDYHFMSGKTAILADTYLREGDMKRGRQYLDSAKLYYDLSQNELGLKDYYRVEARYYSMIGNHKLTNEYIDKAITAEKRYDDTYNDRQMLRVEQRLGMVENRVLTKSIEHEKELKEYYLRNLIIAGILSILLIIFLIALIYNYSRKRKAYAALVQKTKEWAGMKENTVAEATKEDIKLFSAIKKLFEKEQIYRDPDLNIDMLAKRLDVNRLYISRAINRCSGSTFSNLVNEYRIKEAVVLLTEGKSETFSLEGIAFEVGFSQRKTFYSAFKKITGLSPSEYRDNLQRK